MSRPFDRKLQELKTSLVKMGSLVESAIESSIDSIKKRDSVLAEKVINDDPKINELEISTEKIIIDLLALQQPVASDLRFILSASKINNDLERIGDHAVNLAQSAMTLPSLGKPLPVVSGIDELTTIAKRMLADALDGFIHIDAAIGNSVLMMDDDADALNRKITQEMIVLIKSNPKSVEQALEYIRVSRNLERVADLATNIAEEVVFIADARVVKHHAADIPH